ncbi:MAG: putative Ig domain-containing protein, partial [Verrucomicrobia bacterium]|nr:putative Ig domain-containing protein [Verrucomicrobiota bacterium]
TSWEKTIDFGLRGCPAFTISPSTLPSAVQDAAYSRTLTASGGVSPYTWNIVSGELPVGMSLSSSGVISGTTPLLDVSIFSIQVTDAKGCSTIQSYALNSLCPVISLSPTTLTSATRLSAYTQAMTITGGRAPYIVSVTTGALPTGLLIDTNNQITGIPTAAPGNYSFTLTATDAAGCSATLDYSLTVVCPSIALAPIALPTATVAGAYLTSLTPSGGTGPYSFAVSSGTLPTGLGLNTSTGVLSGTPIS